MKILITGITGLFGSYLYRAFADQGEIHGLKREGSTTEFLGKDSEKIIWHVGDINDPLSLEEAFMGMDLIIHAAGLVSFDPKLKEKLWKVNMEGTKNVVNTMIHLKIPRVIHVSSVAALGRIAGVSRVDESQKWVESDLNTSYASSKYHGELEVWRGAQEGLQVMIINPSLILAKANANRSSAAIYQYVLEENRYYPTGTINYIDARDAAAICKNLFLQDAWDERFILNKEGISYRVFFETMGKVFQKKAPDKALSDKWLWLGLILVKVQNSFRSTKKILSKQTAMLAQQDIVFDPSKSLQLTQHKFHSLEETFLWARNEN